MHRIRRKDENTAAPRRGVKTIRSLQRGLEVLQLVQAYSGVSLRDIHRETGLPKATLLRVLLTLQQAGLVWQRVADSAYLASYSLKENARHLDNAAHLVEVASPVLVELTRKVDWPSILAVPRLDYMEVIETNSPRSYFHHIPLGPVGFQINMLMSATGRAYLAFCSDGERVAILARLRASARQGNAVAGNRAWIEKVLNRTREQGFGLRDERFGGNFDKPRKVYDDNRNSIAVPIVVGERIPGVINLTWIRHVATEQQIIAKHLSALKAAASNIAVQLADATLVQRKRTRRLRV